MLKNIDRTGALRRALPFADRIGAVFRDASFAFRIAEHKRVQRSDLQPETSSEEHSETSATGGTDHVSPALRSLSRIALELREALRDLRHSGTMTEATGPRERPTSYEPTKHLRYHPPLLRAPARQHMDDAELALARVRTSIRALRHSRSHEGNWVIVLTPERGDGPVPPSWISELNCQHFTVFDVDMMNDLVISAGSSIVCIVLDGRLEHRALAELAIHEAKQRYPAIRAVLLDPDHRSGDDAPASDAPFDVRLGLTPTRARLKWAIVAGREVPGGGRRATTLSAPS